MGGPILLLMAVIFENGVADSNTLVTNVGARIIRGGGDQLTNNILALVTKRTTERIIRASSLHRDLLKILLSKKGGQTDYSELRALMTLVVWWGIYPTNGR